MKAMILAAGTGQRMRPLTEQTPKPLLVAGGETLVGHHLRRLARAGFREIVINISYLAEQIRSTLGDGADYGVRIHYSQEPIPAYETGGGIFNALSLLGESAFLVVNGDIWCDYPYHRLRQLKTANAHLVLVDNPSHHPGGDFSLSGVRVVPQTGLRLTYAGVGVFHPSFFADCQAGSFPLAPLLHAAALQGRVTAEHYRGEWLDVGTVERLTQLRQRLA